MGFSLCWITITDFEFFRKCGLLLWLVRAHMTIAKANAKIILGEFIYHSIAKAKAKKINLQVFICNRFRADGATPPLGVRLTGRTTEGPQKGP